MRATAIAKGKTILQMRISARAVPSPAKTARNSRRGGGGVEMGVGTLDTCGRPLVGQESCVGERFIAFFRVSQAPVVRHCSISLRRTERRFASKGGGLNARPDGSGRSRDRPRRYCPAARKKARSRP